MIFNLNRTAQVVPFHIATGEEDVTPIDSFNFGDDLEGLLLHELGHAAIGLEHPRWAGEYPDRRVMYQGDFRDPASPPCCTAINHELHPDDIAAAQYIYGVRGDFNRDGAVDAADYVVWRDSVGSIVTSGTGADANVDGTVDSEDFEIWRAHFGDVRLAGFGEQKSLFEDAAAAAVPEPSVVAMAVTVAAIFSASARRRENRPSVERDRRR